MKPQISLYILLLCNLSIQAMDQPEREKQFLRASAEGKIDVVQSLIESGVNINATDKYNETAFYKAVRLEKWPVAHFMLDQPELKLEINPVSSEPQNATTPMHILVKKCRTAEHFRLIERVLALKPNIDVLDGSQNTPLMYEMRSFPNPKVIEALVKAGAAMTADADGRTPLMHAVHWDPKTVTAILHSPHLTLADLQKNMKGCRRQSLYDCANDNRVYGYKFCFEIMKTYYNVMLTLGHIDPLKNEWRNAVRTKLNVPLVTTASQAKTIAANVAEARFKMLHNAWCNS